MNRGVDLDAIAISPVPDLAELASANNASAEERGFKKLASINDVLLDTLMEWHIDGERCIALSEPRGAWRIVYDTQFSHSALADTIAREIPDALVLQFNLQEQVDFTLRALRGERTLYEYSNAPSFFNWGRCLANSEPSQLARPECAALAATIGKPECAAALQDVFQTITNKIPGEAAGTRGRKRGGVYDAAQAIAAHAGLPRLYRFFEGWMKSDLDWVEDNIETVLAFRRSG
jgi:hypothetical protein